MTHGTGPASPWLLRWAHLLPTGGRTLDLACGRGRHLHWLVEQGFQATGVDRDADALAQAPVAAERLQADLEGEVWPLAGRQFDAVLVFNYLWRPRFDQVLGLLAEGGVFIHETFAEDHASVGKPSRPDFLLRHGELLERCAGLRVVAYEDGWLAQPERFVQRIVAIRLPAAAGSPPGRHRLPG